MLARGGRLLLSHGSRRSLVNHAAVLHAPQQLSFDSWPLPPLPPPGCVRIAVEACGICGSDIHYLRHGRIGEFVVTKPLVLGHEAAGRVVALGEGVKGLRVDDRVALEPGVSAFDCDIARKGRYNLDPAIAFAATPPFHGLLASYVDHPAAFCFTLPEDVLMEEGAMCEPLSVGMHALQRGAAHRAARVAILGAGTIGLSTLAVAKAAYGALRLAITDVKQRNLAVAEGMGSDATLLIQPGETGAETAERLRSALGGAPELVIDACGAQSSLDAAIGACASGGAVVIIGLAAQRPSIDTAAVITREVDVRGSFRYAHCYPRALELLRTRRLDVQPLLTHRLGWSPRELMEGFETASGGEAIKVMFTGLGR